MGDWVSEVDFGTDTAIYASGDLLADTEELAGCGEWKTHIVIQSLTLTDFDDQGAIIDVLFFRSNPGSLGIRNTPISITRPQAEECENQPRPAEAPTGKLVSCSTRTWRDHADLSLVWEPLRIQGGRRRRVPEPNEQESFSFRLFSDGIRSSRSGRDSRRRRSPPSCRLGTPTCTGTAPARTP